VGGAGVCAGLDPLPPSSFSDQPSSLSSADEESATFFCMRGAVGDIICDLAIMLVLNPPDWLSEGDSGGATATGRAFFNPSLPPAITAAMGERAAGGGGGWGAPEDFAGPACALRAAALALIASKRGLPEDGGPAGLGGGGGCEEPAPDFFKVLPALIWSKKDMGDCLEGGAGGGGTPPSPPPPPPGDFFSLFTPP